jgi:hypothetical protein
MVFSCAASVNEVSAFPVASKDDDSRRSSLPELWRLRTLHGAFVDHSQFLHRYDSQEISLEEWTAYKNELVARPKPPAHISFAPLF